MIGSVIPFVPEAYKIVWPPIPRTGPLTTAQLNAFAERLVIEVVLEVFSSTVRFTYQWAVENVANRRKPVWDDNTIIVVTILPQLQRGKHNGYFVRTHALKKSFRPMFFVMPTRQRTYTVRDEHGRLGAVGTFLGRAVRLEFPIPKVGKPKPVKKRPADLTKPPRRLVELD